MTKKHRTLCNPTREFAFDSGDDNGFSKYFCGTEALVGPFSRVQLNPAVKEVVEDYHVRHLHLLLQREIPQRIYTQEPIPVLQGEEFVTTMMRRVVLPPNLKTDVRYLRCADLVEKVRTKNGFYRWAVNNGLADKMPPTRLYLSGEIPDVLPFEGRNWLKYSEEKKIPGVPTVMPVESDDPEAVQKMREYFSRSDDERQIQENFRGHMRSPHFLVSEEGVDHRINPFSIVKKDHHVGSHLQGLAIEPSALFAIEFCKKLQADGFFGYINIDVLEDTAADDRSVNEGNLRWGGSEFSSSLMKQLGEDQGSSWREAQVNPEVSVAEIYRRMEVLGVAIYLPGNLANPDLSRRTVGILAVGHFCQDLIEEAKAELLR